MGIADLGLRNVSGTIVPYDLNSTSVWGSITFNRAQSAYVDGDGPDTFGVQLNAVATNVSLFGTPGYQFWTQDFVSYTSSNGSLSFGDNVWNFSSAFAPLTPNVFSDYGPNGTPVAPIFYYATGPTFTVAYPFTVNLYLNATLSASALPEVFFNYSLVDGAGAFSGSFDHVVFNAVGPCPCLVPPIPRFQVNGTGLGPSGLPNDYELVVVGNDDGDTTTFFSINASLSLAYWNGTAGAYRTVPSALDAGSDTGETSNGLLPVFRWAPAAVAPVVSLRLGPSFVLGLWHLSAALNGSRQFNVLQRPQAAFLFVSPGASFNNSSAQWVPTLRLGLPASQFSIPNTGAFQLRWMMSDRAQANYSVSTLLPLANSTTTLSEVLAVQASAGSYTPLFAWGNSQLGPISQHGNGTFANPFVLIHHPVGSLASVFGQLNDFGFPVFAGVLLVGTHAFVHVLQPAVSITYGSWELPQLSQFGLPAQNQLQLEFWNVSNVSVVNSSSITGWLSADLSAFPEGQVLFWGSSSNLIANDTFVDEGCSLALYGGTNNTVWGNRFLAGSVSQAFYQGNNTTGLLEWESGDLVYNNYFAVGQPAITPTYDAFSCQVLCLPATYTDRWNVSKEPASGRSSSLGMVLTGSILRTWYQGGNYWSNYGSPQNPFGVLPYNDSGLITVEGDYVPLVLSSIYTITFVEHGLAAGTPWNVSLLGRTTGSTSTTLSVGEPNGSYAYSEATVTGYLGPGPGTAVVNGTNLSIDLNFTPLYAVTAFETGLVTGWSWGISFVNETGAAPNLTLNSTLSAASGLLANGSYEVSASAYGYVAGLAGSVLVVDGVSASLTVTFLLVHELTVVPEGLPGTLVWTVTVQQGSNSVNLSAGGTTAIVFTALELNPGPYTWTVSARGYAGTPSGGSGTAPGPSPTNFVTFRPAAGGSGPSHAIPWAWIVAAVLAALAVVGLLLYARERRRPRTPAPMLAAPPVVAAAGEGTEAEGAAAPAPWEEGPADSESPEPYRRSP